jgi:hypothetical protein
MAEVEIKRTNFFDGQFLKQGEFLDMDTYHVHMRRRWAFVMFNQSGVIQAGASDLRVDVPNTAVKSLLVRAGMAVGKRPDLAEAKEVVLRADTALIDLTTSSVNVPTPLVAGDTGFVTVHYVEEPVAIPASEGDVPGNTRILEHARITVHNAAPPPSAPNGEPFIRLGDVTFNTMATSTAARQTAFFNASLLAQPPQITFSPNTLPATGNVSATVTSSGGLNLAGLTLGQITISPPAGIAVTVGATSANSATLNLTLTNAGVGLHNVSITTNLTAATSFSVQAVTPAPTLTSLPISAIKTQNMTIGGTNFDAPVTVTFVNGGAVVSSFITLSPTQIVLQVPNAALSGAITVNAAGGSVNSVTANVPAATNGIVTII